MWWHGRQDLRLSVTLRHREGEYRDRDAIRRVSERKWRRVEFWRVEFTCVCVTDWLTVDGACTWPPLCLPVCRDCITRWLVVWDMEIQKGVLSPPCCVTGWVSAAAVPSRPVKSFYRLPPTHTPCASRKGVGRLAHPVKVWDAPCLLTEPSCWMTGGFLQYYNLFFVYFIC